MDRNVGGADRRGRIAIAIALLLVGFRYRNRLGGTVAFIAGADLLATAVIGRCPLNALFGIDTCPDS